MNHPLYVLGWILELIGKHVPGDQVAYSKALSCSDQPKTSPPTVMSTNKQLEV